MAALTSPLVPTLGAHACAQGGFELPGVATTPHVPEPASDNDRTGLPRPMVTPFGADDLVRDGLLREGRKLPAPWINGAAGLDGNFLDFRKDVTRAETERLCCVCGDELHELVAIAAMNGERETSGGWGHPRCVALAVRLCPHFLRDDALAWPVVAYLHRGPGVGVTDPTFSIDTIDDAPTPLTRTELTDLARTDPWGHATTVQGASA